MKPDKKFLERFKNEKIAVHCETKENSNAFIKWAKDNGTYSYMQEGDWNTYKKRTCYTIGGYGLKQLYIDDNYTIIKYKDLTSQPEYTTKPIDYEGCDPVIAEHLKQNLSVKCIVWDNDAPEDKEERVVEHWISKNKWYVCGPEFWDNAEPTPKKTKVVKSAPALMQQLIDDGYEVDGCGDWIKGDSHFYTNMWRFCGQKPYASWEWLDQWLEEYRP